jgi:hypothetical protein
MIAQLPTQPDNSFTHYALLVLIWIVTTTASGWIGYHWGLRSQKELEKFKARNALIVMLDGFIDAVNKGGGGLGKIRGEAQEELFKPAMLFRTHLKGKRLRLFNEAWGSLANTTRDEVNNEQPNTIKDHFEQMQRLLLFRLTAIREIVQAA